MNHLGLFEGIGGFSLAARWAGWQTPVMVEWNKYCQAVLKNNFPYATIFGDIRKFDGLPYAGQIDIITGGFPCQPYSSAGKRLGNSDDRALWPEMLRVIREVGPEWVVGENVAGLLTMDGGRVFAAILADLEDAGYSTETYIIPAIAVGAPHRRDRVWIVAHANGGGRAWRSPTQGGNVLGNRGNGNGKGSGWDFNEAKFATNAGRRDGAQPGLWSESESIGETDEYCYSDSGQHWQEPWLQVAARICRMDDGFPAGLDGVGAVPDKAKKGKAHRLEALGNAIVPQVAYQIFKAINKYNK